VANEAVAVYSNISSLSLEKPKTNSAGRVWGRTQTEPSLTNKPFVVYQYMGVLTALSVPATSLHQYPRARYLSLFIDLATQSALGLPQHAHIYSHLNFSPLISNITLGNADLFNLFWNKRLSEMKKTAHAYRRQHFLSLGLTVHVGTYT
jgi:hypothetical protein